MSRLKLAFVNFFKETRGKKIVAISDIENFKPTHHSDFERDETYQVKWPHFPNDGSFSTEGTFEAYIMCLGVNINDLKHEAKMKKIHIPSELCKPSSKSADKTEGSSVSSRGRPVKRTSKAVKESSSEPPPRPKKKKKPNLKEVVKAERNLNALESMIEATLPFKSSDIKANKGEEEVKVDCDNTSSSEDDKVTLHELSLKSKYQSKVDDRELHHVEEKQNDKEFSEKSTKKECPFSSKGKTEKSARESESSVTESTSKSQNICSNPPEENSTFKEKEGNNYQKIDSDSASSSEETTDPYVPSDEERELYFQKMLKLQDTCKTQESSLREAKERLNSLEQEVSTLKKEITCLTEDKEKLTEENLRLQKLTVSLSEKLMENYDSFEARRHNSLGRSPVSSFAQVKQKKNLSPCSSATSFHSASTKVNEVASSSKGSSFSIKPFSNANSSVNKPSSSHSVLTSVHISVPSKGCKASPGFGRSPSTRFNSSPFQYVKSPLSYGSAESSPAKSLRNKYGSPNAGRDLTGSVKKALWKEGYESPGKGNRDSQADELSCKSPKEPTTHSETVKPHAKKTAKKNSIDLDDKSKYSHELSSTIFDALQKKLPLRSDGCGKSHLGNNVWISTALLDDKISKTLVTPTIALRDAMSNIYTIEELAERSLEGGTPVEEKTKKKKLTAAKREALLGLFRAKTQQTTGSTDKNYLDLMASQKGKSTIREKLREADNKLNPKKKKQGSLPDESGET